MSDGYGKSTGGFGISRDEIVSLLVRTALDEGVTDERHISYILATAQHETRNFDAPEEDYGRKQARTLGYDGGENFYGRGYVHLTHIKNYEKFDRLLGMDGKLVRDPSLAMAPDVAAKVIVLGMRDGLFTGKRLSDYINQDADFFNARRVVNGVSENSPWSVAAAHSCAEYAGQWMERVPGIIERIRSERTLPPPLEGLDHPALNRPNGVFGMGPLSVQVLQQPDHPLHNGFTAIQRDVAAWETRIGKTRDGHTENLELSLLRHATLNGIQPEWVMPSIANEHVRAGQNVFIGQGDPSAHPRRYVYMDTQTAINTPATESLRQIDTALSQVPATQAVDRSVAVITTQDDPNQRMAPRL